MSTSNTAPANRFARLATTELPFDLLFEHILTVPPQSRPAAGRGPRRRGAQAAPLRNPPPRGGDEVPPAPSSYTENLGTRSEREAGRSRTQTTTLTQSTTMTSTSAYEDAITFAREVEDLHQSLAQAHAAHANVKKLAESNNFRVVDWAILEEGIPLDAAEVLKKLEADIKDKEAGVEAATKGLEEAMSRLDEDERRSWWLHCQRRNSSVDYLKEYAPVLKDEAAAKDDEIEDDVE
ncbi:hypothetical protein BU25DRAFT_425156 [Macroventuria anomochaeta]|uniref:Uncharacterized protein n=1 Tax=Macroventuria anomochaeta TaxID=301207 RepID=A0ACB6RN48_9PLEO|nr:uncharacterized protein BU25DRAFT_425156 [Macroventuria anomochaeta]KAF2623147.1 hypothetical protein BU25DRAFT_425156 [Macroventuria anomochaeta]